MGGTRYSTYTVLGLYTQYPPGRGWIALGTVLVLYIQCIPGKRSRCRHPCRAPPSSSRRTQSSAPPPGRLLAHRPGQKRALPWLCALSLAVVSAPATPLYSPRRQQIRNRVPSRSPRVPSSAAAAVMCSHRSMSFAVRSNCPLTSPILRFFFARVVACFFCSFLETPWCCMYNNTQSKSEG